MANRYDTQNGNKSGIGRAIFVRGVPGPEDLLR